MATGTALDEPMNKYDHPDDPRGLIFEAYQLDLDAADCRTIFFDWALGHTGTVGPAEIANLLKTWEPQHPDHPMTAVLRDGLNRAADGPRRRGGASGHRSRREE